MSDYILLNTSITNNQTSFLIDTQADISLIKEHVLLKPTNIDSRYRIQIQGITRDTVSSLGNISSKLYLNADTLINQQFQVVHSSFPIPADGILGKDFIKANRCTLDFNSMYLTVCNDNRYLNLPLIQETTTTHISIPPRCEVFRKMKCGNIIGDHVIDQQEIIPGVFTAQAIVSDSNPLVRILNTNSYAVSIPSSHAVTSTPLSNFHVLNKTDTNPVRTNEILKHLTPNFPNFAKDRLTDICSKYTDIFALENEPISTNNFYQQRITVNNNKPIYIKNYRIPHIMKKEINEQVTSMLQRDIIEPSTSAYNSPIILVPKKSSDKTQKWRFCVDYRQLNKHIIPDRFPLPRIDDILDSLGRAKFFSILDLFSGFHQVSLHPDSRDITSFSTEQGSYRFKTLPFGLNLAPNSFARMMSIAFSGLNPTTSFLYLDDIIVIGASEDHHLKNLTSVFDTLRKHNLKLNPNKCRFFRKEVTFLGHKCTDKGILPDNSKFSVINQYPRPTDKDAVKRFIAFCNYYRRFIKNFANIAYPLNVLTRKRTDFIWSDECEQAFKTLKNSLIKPPILQYPDFDKQFIVTVDAAKHGSGAILSQVTDNNDLPVAFASMAFTKGELNKSVIEKELTAIHWAIKFFKPYIYGTKFLVRSDHKPLQYLFAKKDPSSKLTRMRLDLLEYDFEIEYIPGKQNVGADALSRIDFKLLKILDNNTSILRVTTRSMNTNKHELPVKDPTERTSIIHAYEPINCSECYCWPQLTFVSNNKDNVLTINIFNKKRHLLTTRLVRLYGTHDEQTLQLILKAVAEMANDINRYNFTVYLSDDIFKMFNIEVFKQTANATLTKLSVAIIPPVRPISSTNEKLKLFKMFHNDPVHGGHCGVYRLYSKLKSQYKWHNMLKDVKDYVSKCKTCTLNKPAIKNREYLQLTPTPQQAFDITIIDTIGPFPISENGNRYALTAICDLTKYLIVIPIPNKEAITIAKAIFFNIIRYFGILKVIRTDLGTEYANNIMLELCKLLKIEHKTSTPYRHESLGTIERNHRTLNEYLRSYINNNHTDWDHYVLLFNYCYNMTPSTVLHGYTPFELVFGKRPTTPEFISSPITPIYNIDNFAKELKHRLQVAHSRVQEYLQKDKVLRKTFYDGKASPANLNINDKVLVRDEARHKLDPVYKGPLVITRIDGVNASIRDPVTRKTTTVHKNRLVLYK
jgi:Retroviral aspartyl protease./Reverse transcriptase (RNA-dependent DNA polymerase)./Integrase core domain.